ncbi:hypothetical protein GCM10025734_36880 [Kitasatospora paranensis]
MNVWAAGRNLRFDNYTYAARPLGRRPACRRLTCRPAGERTIGVTELVHFCRGIASTGNRHAIYRRIETWVALGNATIDSGTATAIMNQDRRGTGQHIVRVARPPTLPAFSQVSGGLTFRWGA